MALVWEEVSAAFLSYCIALSLIDSALPALGIDLDAAFPVE